MNAGDRHPRIITSAPLDLASFMLRMRLRWVFFTFFPFQDGMSREWLEIRRFASSPAREPGAS